MKHSPLQLTLFVGFVASITYVGGTLPAGRFYYEGVEGFFGNSILKTSYQYIYLYLLALLHCAELAERRVLAFPALLPSLLTTTAAGGY